MAARAERLAEQERIAREAEQERLRIIAEREADPIWQATKRIRELEEAAREAERTVRQAVNDRNKLLKQQAEAQSGRTPAIV